MKTVEREDADDYSESFEDDTQNSASQEERAKSRLGHTQAAKGNVTKNLSTHICVFHFYEQASYLDFK